MLGVAGFWPGVGKVDVEGAEGGPFDVVLGKGKRLAAYNKQIIYLSILGFGPNFTDSWKLLFDGYPIDMRVLLSLRNDPFAVAATVLDVNWVVVFK